MTGVIAHWELPAQIAANPKATKKYYTRWTHTLKAFGIKDLALIAVDPVPPFGDQEINLRVFDSLNDALEELEGTPVFVEQGGTDVVAFKFPDDPLFVLGSDYGQLPRADVSIGTHIPLHADNTCAIVLHEWRSRGLS